MRKSVVIVAVSLFFPALRSGAEEPSGHVFLKRIVTQKNRVQLYLSGHAEPVVTMKADPPRIIIDLPGVSYGNVGRVLPGKGGVLKRIRTAMISAETENLRLVLDLSRPVPFSEAWKGDRWTIALGLKAEEIETASDASFEEESARAKAVAEIVPASAEKPAPKPAEAIAADAPIPISALYGVPPSSVKAGPDTEEPPIPISELYKTAPSAAEPQSVPAPTLAASLPAPAPAPGAEAKQGYMVQLGSFKDEGRAKTLKAEIVAGSISFVKISAVTVNGVRYHRVGVGPYKVRAQAEAMVKELGEMGHEAMVLINRTP